jgi:hypothetical protein
MQPKVRGDESFAAKVTNEHESEKDFEVEKAALICGHS